MIISENLKRLLEQIPGQVTLVAVSKTYPPEAILEAYSTGHRIFGENRVQELTSKYEVLPRDIQWHQIGHLQKNKVKYIAPFVAMIHAVDDVELLAVIQKEAAKAQREISCLIQIHIAQEVSKFGFSYDEAREFFRNFNSADYPNVKVSGLMGMATFTEDEAQIRSEFRGLAAFFRELQEGFMKDESAFKHLSMGMSGDYRIAIEEGSTMIRVGSAIFGARC